MRSNREERCHPLAADFPTYSPYTGRYGCARGGSTVNEVSGAGRKTPGSPSKFILGSIAHFGRTREAVSSRPPKKSPERPVSRKGKRVGIPSKRLLHDAAF